MTESRLENDSELLLSIAREHRVPLAGDCAPLLCRYCQLLWEFNAHINLTRHLDYSTFVTRDLVDCVHLSQVLGREERVLDIGAGGGVPGLVLAMMRPDLDVSLSESVGKKAAVLKTITERLDVTVPVFSERAEQVLEHESFSTLVARAVGPLWKILTWFDDRWDKMDRLLLIKGPRWVAERAEARHRGLLRSLELRRILTYDMPGRDGQSVILSIWRK